MKIGLSSGTESKSSKRKQVIPRLRKPPNKQGVDEETQGIIEDQLD